MDEILLLSLFFLAVFLLIAIPIALSVLVYLFVEKRNFDKRLKLIALLPVVALGYFLYDAFYPRDEFYRNDFKEVTGIELPENAEIQYKTTSFPDHFGDYTSVSLIKADREFYSKLPQQLLTKGLLEKQERSSSKEFCEVLQHRNNRTIERVFGLQDSGVYYCVGLLSDKESFIVQRISW